MVKYVLNEIYWAFLEKNFTPFCTKSTIWFLNVPWSVIHMDAEKHISALLFMTTKNKPFRRSRVK